MKMIFLLKPWWTVFLAQGQTSGRTCRCLLSDWKNEAAERQKKPELRESSLVLSRRELFLCAGPEGGYVNALRPPETVH